jgi:uncharacterized protein YdhG (YjbR/CyaY superfamily)
MARPKNIDEYIASAPKGAHKNLRALRAVLKKAAPKAKEVVKWGMPMFEEKRILFAFAGFKDHINFLPTPDVIRAFKKDLGKYGTTKGAVQLSYNAPIPAALIRKMALHRAKLVQEKDARWM